MNWIRVLAALMEFAVYFPVCDVYQQTECRSCLAAKCFLIDAPNPFP
ncbi:hypothetical protein [Parageobacillus sp. KH3-4]|nr:hypothetical protein [Parageobacillus sp. KH3-4]